MRSDSTRKPKLPLRGNHREGSVPRRPGVILLGLDTADTLGERARAEDSVQDPVRVHRQKSLGKFTLTDSPGRRAG